MHAMIFHSISIIPCICIRLVMSCVTQSSAVLAEILGYCRRREPLSLRITEM